MRRALRNERGIALAVALFALVVMSALVAGTFFAGRLEQQSGRNTLFAVQAADAAEAGLLGTMSSLASSMLIALPVGGAPLDLGAMPFSPGFRVERQVSRLTSTLFLVRAFGARLDAAGTPLATRSVGRLVHLLPDTLGGAPIAVPLRQRGWAQLH
jgi:hypothetical protein